MNVQQYHRLIRNPALLNKDTLKEIEDLVKNFPMVENFRILLALNLLILDDYRYDAAITNAAIYSSDRKRLKEWVDYILSSLNQVKEEIKTGPLTDEPINEETDTMEKVLEEVKQEEKEVVVKDPEEVTEKPVQAEFVEQSVDTQEPETTNIETEKKNIRSKKELLRLVRKRLDEIEAEKTREKEIKPEKDDQTINARLIDRFIEQEPSISRPDKNEFFDPQNEAMESAIDEDDFFVTETLAQIHTQQGNLKKAKEIYRKLILKNPEKSSYFAAQIEKLTKK